MKKFVLLLGFLTLVSALNAYAQSGRKAPAPAPKPKADTQSQSTSPESTDNGITDAKISPEGETIEGDVIRFDTALVTVPVTVVDRYGHYVPQLQRSDFKILEDGVEQKITYFATNDQPITVVLVIDTSGSTSFRLEDIQEAALAFVDKLKPGDSVMVMSFDDRIQVLAKPTTDREVIRKAVHRTQGQDSRSSGRPSRRSTCRRQRGSVAAPMYRAASVPRLRR